MDKPGPVGCVVGKVEACPCPGQDDGTQRCLADGTFGECECDTDDMGATDASPPDFAASDTAGDAGDVTHLDASDSRDGGAPSYTGDCTAQMIHEGGTFARAVDRPVLFTMFMDIPDAGSVEWLVNSSNRSGLTVDPAEPRRVTVDMRDIPEVPLNSIIALVERSDGSTCRAWKTFLLNRPGELAVLLTWHTPGDTIRTPEIGSDLDLHFLHPNGQWNDAPWDIFWRNPTADWGAPGADDDPVLKNDDVAGDGPEFLHYPSPIAETFKVGVHYHADNDFGPSIARLEIFSGASLLGDWTAELPARQYFWYAADVTMPSGAITVVDLVADGFPQR